MKKCSVLHSASLLMVNPENYLEKACMKTTEICLTKSHPSQAGSHKNLIEFSTEQK